MKSIVGLYNWIDALPEPVREAVLREMQIRKCSDGETIHAAGDPSDACFRVKSGAVRLLNYTLEGKAILMVEFQPGDCFGEAGLIDELARYNTACAVGETLLQILPKKSFYRLYETYGEIPRALNRFFAYRIRQLYALAEDACVLPLRERLVSLIARLASSRGLPSEDGTILGGASHETLAQMLGATRQAVSRELKSLERDGLVKIKYGKLLIPDLAELIAKYEQCIASELVVPKYNSPS